jgi:DNA-binding MarR family transcriptional regulator
MILMPRASNTQRPAPVPRSAIGRGGIPIRRAAAPLVRRLQQICVFFVAEALSGSGLVQLEYALLVFLDDVPGIDQRRLSEALGIDRNNVSLIVDRLEARGLVRRAIGRDRRARHLSLTPHGKSLRDSWGFNTRVTNDRILAPLKARERKLFLDMLIRLVEAHHLHARPGAGRRKRGSGNGKE